MSGLLGGTLLLAVIVLIAIASFAVGRAKGRRLVAEASRQSVKEAEWRYHEGYLAGHLAGWRDAGARRHGEAASGVVAPFQATPVQAAPFQAAPLQPAPMQPPSVSPPTVRVQAVPPPAWPTPASPRPGQPSQLPPRPVHIPSKSPSELRTEQAARKVRRDRQNINVTLYVASLLLVAAGALFIGTNLPAVLRFAAVWVITGAFYAGGFILHAKVPRLRPAAVAFAGTGLALIPLTGLAMYNFALHNAPAAWLVTSVVGTVAYVLAAARLDNQVLAFLSLSFVVSTAWSGVAVLGGALVWYFACLIGLAVLLTLVVMRNPQWLPSVYARPLMVLHPYVVPFVALAVTFVPQHLAKGQYPAIIMVCGLYFAVMAAIPQGRYRLQQYFAARAAFTAAIPVAVWDAGAALPEVLMTAFALLAIQALWAAFGSARVSRWFPAPSEALVSEDRARVRSRVDAAACFGLQLVSGGMVCAAILHRDSAIPLGLPVFVALLCSFALARKFRGWAEWLPVAAVAAAAPYIHALGGWTTAGLLVLAGAFWLLRAISPSETRRKVFVLAARVAITLAVPAVVAGILPETTERAPAVGLAFIAAAEVQLLLEAVFLRVGLGTLAPGASLVAFAGAGATAIPVALLIERGGAHYFGSAAIMVQALAGVAASSLLFPRRGDVLARTPKIERLQKIGELLAPAALAWTAALAFGVVSLALGNTILLFGLVYVASQALRLPRSLHRRGYWWLARGLATLLAGTGYLQLLEAGGSILVAGEPLKLATVIFLAFALQLIPSFVTSVRGAASGPATLEAAVVLSFMAGAASVVSISGPYFNGSAAESWQAGAVAVLLAVASVASGFLLRTEAAAAVFAPATLVCLLVLRGGHVHEIEVFLSIFVCFAAAMVAAAPGRIARGSYFLAARLLTGALAVVFAQDVSASASVVSLTFAGVLVLQHLVRWFMRNRLQEVPFQQAAVWVTLASQAVLPSSYLFYLVQSDANDGGRWVLLLELALLLVSAVVADRVFAARSAVYLGIPAAIALVMAAGPELQLHGGTWLAEPPLSNAGVSGVLLVLAMLVTSSRLLLSPGAGIPERWFWLVAALSFATAGGLLSLDAPGNVKGVAVLVVALVCFVASHVEGLPALYAPASLGTLVGATVFADGVLGDFAIMDPTRTSAAWSEYFPWLLGCAAVGLMLYAVRWSGIRSIGSQPERALSLAVGAGFGLLVSAGAGLMHDATALAGTGLLSAAVVIALIEGPRGIRLTMAELGSVVVLAAAERALLFTHGAKPEIFWVLQWFVVLGAVLAGLRYYRGSSIDGRLRLGLAAGLLSLGGFLAVFTGTAPQQLWILIGHAVLLLAGLLLAERLFVWWGALGIALSIMWALRSYAFALLALIALGLIGLAVWRLIRTAPPAP